MRKTKIDIVASVGLRELFRAIQELANEIPVEELVIYDAERLESTARNIRFRLSEAEKDRPRIEAIAKILSEVKLVKPYGEKV